MFCNINNNVFKDERGRWRTFSLFVERQIEGIIPLWTMKDDDIEIEGKLYPSLKKIYLSFEHIPGYEYDFAIQTFGSWDHWVKLTNSGIKSLFAEWRQELEILNKSKAIKSLIRTSQESGAAGANAAKYFAERGYASKRGRPSGEEVEREKKIAAGLDKELKNDLERINLKLVKQG